MAHEMHATARMRPLAQEPGAASPVRDRGSSSGREAARPETAGAVRVSSAQNGNSAGQAQADGARSEMRLLERMAQVIHLQSQRIAGLEERVRLLEESSRSTPRSQLAMPSASSAAAAAPTARAVSAPSPGIFFRALVYGGSGYSEENWVEAVALADHGFPIQLAPIGEQSDGARMIPDISRQKLSALQHQLINLPASVIYQAAPAGMWELELSGRRRVGRTMFETDRIPHTFVEPCNAMEEVWVPTQFNLESFIAGGVEARRLRVVPPGVDASLFRPGAEPLEIAKKRGFTFLSIFDWQQRKGYDVLLKAYLNEFKGDEDVSLLLKVSQMNDMASDLEAELIYFIERSAGVRLENAPPVILLRANIPQPEMPGLYAAADCFVLPSRGEGYGRPYLEAMACQLPVIATGWSGQKDFLTNENSYLIDYRVVPVCRTVDLEVFRGHRWAEPDIDHLRELMRAVYCRRDEARRRAAQARQDILRRHDWKVVIPTWVNEFRRLLG